MKKTFISFLFIGSIARVAFAGDLAVPSAATGSITVKVSNSASTKGQFAMALFSAPEGFPGKPEKAVRSTMIPASDPKGEIVFKNVPYGVYAISVFHDENSNGKLDTVFLLPIPKERYGSSNNPKARKGPPSFEESKFTLDRSELDMDIVLK